MDKEGFIDFYGKKIWYRLAGPSGKSVPAILFVHGSSFSTSLQTVIDLLKKRFLCMGFAHLGLYKSGGNLQDDTLESRFQQSRFMLSFLMKRQDVGRVSLVGVSMGGHVAARLAGENKVKNLILRSPASYKKDYENTVMHPEGWLPWDREKMEWPWKPSRAFEAISQFKGRLLIVDSEFEEVVAKKIPNEYYRSAEQVKEKKRIELKGAKHYIGDDLPIIKKFSQVISDFLST